MKQILLSLEANFKTSLLRLAAGSIDLLLWVVLAIFTLLPGFIAATVLVAFGYLENFSFPFVWIVSAVMVYLAVALSVLNFLIPYYPCRFESADWQGTLGKFVLGLKCSNDAGERLSFSRVAGRLALQFLIISMLSLVAFLTVSPFFHQVVTACIYVTWQPGLVKVFWWTDRIMVMLLFAPYLMALLMPKNQTLIDFMSRRMVRRDQTRAKVRFGLLPADFLRILLPDDTPQRKRITKYVFGTSIAFIAVWLFSLVLSISACLALPVSVAQADQLSKTNDQSALEKFKRNALFKHLDLIYGLLASNARTSHEFRRQCLSKAIMLDPRRHFYWYWRAENYLANGRYAEALADASEAIKTYDINNATAQYQSIFGLHRINVVPVKDIDINSLYTLRATIEQKLGDKQAAFSDLTKTIGTAGHEANYQKWLELQESINKEKESDAKVQLAKVTAIANDAYKILLKSPARFQEKKDLYNDMIDLNNAGVSALAQDNADAAIERFHMAIKVAAKLQSDGVSAPDDFDKAFKKWQSALDLDSRYDLAWRNLSIAYNGKAKTISNPEVALKYFHRALYFDPLNEPALVNTDAAIKKLGLDPGSFVDHIKLAGSAAAAKDDLGAVVEYTLALKIKKDSDVEGKLALLKSKMPEAWLMKNWQ